MTKKVIDMETYWNTRVQTLQRAKHIENEHHEAHMAVLEQELQYAREHLKEYAHVQPS